MLTIFSIPKGFQGNNAIIQENALASWSKLSPVCQLVLCGDDPGVAEIAAKYGATHLPDIERTELGTPLLSSAFQQVVEIAEHSQLCYVNADIILFDSIVKAADKVSFDDYLLIGQRWDTRVDELIIMDHEGWDQAVITKALNNGRTHGPTGMDFFVFPKFSRLTPIPPFAVGRPGWDNWMVSRALDLKIHIVDLTGFVVALHQNHDYEHVPCATGQRWEGPEADHNLHLLGLGRRYPPDIRDATHTLKRRDIKRVTPCAHIARHVQRHPLKKHVYALLRPFKRAFLGRGEQP
ncbi:MAG: hypothetical protein WCL39_15025 [Armatimonadota bacterium]